MGPARHRLAILAASLALTGCSQEASHALGWSAVATGASIIVFDRTPVDLVVSLAKGQDCSVLNLEPLGEYCRSPTPPPEPAPFCIRTLANVECYPTNDPYGRQRSIVDAPALTAAQTKRAAGSWP